MKVIWFLALGLLFACVSVPGEILLSDADNGKTISASANQIIVITLDSNITTGFKWNLVAEPDTKIVKVISSEYVAPSNPIPGAGGKEIWKFQAVGAGSTSLKLAYFRPFDAKNVAKEYWLSVTVK